MKNLISLFLATMMSFSGFFALSPALVYADNDNSGKNKSNQEIKQIKQEAKQEIKKIKEEVKKVSTWGAFMSSVKSNRSGNKFSNWFWWNKDFNKINDEEDEDRRGRDHDNDDDDDDNNENNQNNTQLSLSLITARVSTSTVVIRWNTNKLADSKVLFGTSSTSLSQIVSDNALSFDHRIVLNGLTPLTTYYYVVNSKNASSTEVQSNVRSFKTATTTVVNPPSDVTPPQVLFASNLGLQANTTSLIWLTNELAKGKIWISTTTPVGTSTAPIVFSDTLAFFHNLSLPSLATSTLYHFTIESTDTSGNSSYYSNSFTTPAF